MKTLLIAAASLVAAELTAAPVDWSKLPPAATTSGVTFDKDIAPIFKASCVRCHSGERPRSQLRLDTLDGVLKGSKGGPVLIAGDSAHSVLVQAVSQLDPHSAMPPKPRPPRPMGTNSPAMTPHGGPSGEGPAAPPPGAEPKAQPPMGGTNSPAQFQSRLRPMGPPPKPLTPEQVGLVRAWIDQGAK